MNRYHLLYPNVSVLSLVHSRDLLFSPDGPILAEVTEILRV